MMGVVEVEVIAIAVIVGVEREGDTNIKANLSLCL